MHCGEESDTLQTKHPNAFLLLCQIARRARYTDCPITGLKIGQAFIGDWKLAGIESEMAYRIAKKRLLDSRIASFKGTNRGTIATLESTRIFSITEDANNGQNNRPATDKERTNNGQGTTNHKEYKEYKGHLPPNPHGEDSQNPEAESEMFPETSAKPDDRWLPKNWKNLTKEQRKRIRVDANSPAMETIGKFFGRKPGTLWTVAEGAALFELKPTPDEVEILARYYAIELEKESDYRRRDLATLLNNWQTEIDRARTHYASTKT
jgi:hypothetical protein